MREKSDTQSPKPREPRDLYNSDWGEIQVFASLSIGHRHGRWRIVCPLNKEMVQFENIFWKTLREENQGPESFTEAEVQDAIYSCRR